MKIPAQTNDQLKRLCELIEPIRIARLTTMGDDVALTSRPPSVLEVDNQGKFWFYTSVSSQKVKHLHPMNLGFADLALLEFTPDIAEFWDAPNSKMVRLFAAHPQPERR